MTVMLKFAAPLFLLAAASQVVAAEVGKALPDTLVVLTFDDGNVSDYTTVAPILREHGFGATFFITSGWLGRDKRLGWPEVVKLQEAGFEIGCHSSTHPNLLNLTAEAIRRQIADFDRECAAHGVKKATSFAYPGGHFDRRTLAVLKEQGYRAARRGRDPERPLEDNGGTGRAYIPGEDDPYLIPSTMTRGIAALADEQIEFALSQASGGAVAVLTYHGVPDVHPHCSVPIKRFRADMKLLKDSGATVVSLRDLDRYVDFTKRPKDPFAPIVRRLGMSIRETACDTSGPLPRFSWQVEPNGWTQEQVGYRILVASRRELLDRDHGDLWDSGKVDGDPPLKVPYGGKALESGVNYWWKVQCWNRRDDEEIDQLIPYQSRELVNELRKSRLGPFSAPAVFEFHSQKP